MLQERDIVESFRGKAPMLLLIFKPDQVAQALVQLSFEYVNDGDSTASLGGLGQAIMSYWLMPFCCLESSHINGTKVWFQKIHGTQNVSKTSEYPSIIASILS